MSAGLIGAARARTRTDEDGMLGEMECVWRLCGSWLSVDGGERASRASLGWVGRTAVPRRARRAWRRRGPWPACSRTGRTCGGRWSGAGRRPGRARRRCGCVRRCWPAAAGRSWMPWSLPRLSLDRCSGVGDARNWDSVELQCVPLELSRVDQTVIQMSLLRRWVGGAETEEWKDEVRSETVIRECDKAMGSGILGLGGTMTLPARARLSSHLRYLRRLASRARVLDNLPWLPF